MYGRLLGSSIIPAWWGFLEAAKKQLPYKTVEGVDINTGRRGGQHTN